MSKKISFSLKKANKNFNLIACATIFICISVFVIFQFIFLEGLYTFTVKQKMILAANNIAQLYLQKEDFKTVTTDYETENNYYIEIYTPKEVLVYTTQSNNTIYEPDTDKQNNIVLKPRIMNILSRTEREDNSYFEIRQEHYANAQYIVYGNFYGDTAIEIYYPVEAVIESANTAKWSILCLGIFTFIIISATIFFYSNSFAKPLKQITASTKRISEMKFDEECPDFKIKELNELSSSINTLSKSLNKTMTELRDKNLQLEKNAERNMLIEKSRRTFVANVSHELKTPISIIQGYAEGMKVGIGCESTEEFCDIIIDESEKMNRLVIRLMELTHYESGSYKLKISRQNLKQILVEYTDSMKQLIDENGIRLEIYIDDDIFVNGDPEMIINVFNNYFTNAISHIGNEKYIRVRVEENENKYRVYVFNQGTPIPGSDIENIWKSFYRADKSHSRKEGHFGLGLSFVATLQEIYGEAYGVSNLDDGVEFWFDLKRAD